MFTTMKYGADAYEIANKYYSHELSALKRFIQVYSECPKKIERSFNFLPIAMNISNVNSSIV